VVGVPAATDVGLLLRLLPDFGDLRMAGHGLEEAVDVDLPEPLGEGDVLLGRQRLVAEEDDAVFVQRAAQFVDARLVERFGEIDAEDFGAQRAGRRRDVETMVAHDVLPAFSGRIAGRGTLGQTKTARRARLAEPTP